LDGETKLYSIENQWKKVWLDPQAARLVQVRITQAARNIASKSVPVYLEGLPRLVAFIILGVWYQDRMEGLLEEPSEREEAMTRKPKAKQGNPGAKSLIFCCICTYTIHIAFQNLPHKQRKSVFTQPS
jgi:hypothetical protein